MKQTIVIFSIVVQAIGAQGSPYKQFQSYMDVPGGRLLEIDFYQEQLGDRFASSGILYYTGNDRYTFDDQNQRITYNSGTVTTINVLSSKFDALRLVPLGKVTESSKLISSAAKP